MRHGLRWFVLTVLALGLPACMGGGGSNGVSTGVGVNAFVGPAPDATPQQNGLPYATGGQSIENIEEVEIDAITAAFSDGVATTGATVQISLGAGFFADPENEKDAVAAFLGENVTIVDGEGRLSNGQTVRLLAEPASVGTSVAAIQLVSFAAFTNPPPTDPVNAEAYYVLGFLTDPVVIDHRVSGNVIYAGDITATGIVTVDGAGVSNPVTELDGAVMLTVSFQDDWVSGGLNAQYAADAEMVQVNLAMPMTGFAGNTFAGAFHCVTDGGCVSDTTLDAGFYGPSGGEIGGVLDINVIQEVGDETLIFDGAGSFIVSPN